MAMKVLPKAEEAKMNMTPMIDMTFLLVVFFMLTIDLSNKEFEPVSLPYAYNGVEIKAGAAEGPPRFIVNLRADGTISFKGSTFNVANPNTAEANDALQDLIAKIQDMHTQDPSLFEPGPQRASKVSLLIHADRAASWKYVQWIMQAATRQNIYKIEFSVKKHPAAVANGTGS